MVVFKSLFVLLHLSIRTISNYHVYSAKTKRTECCSIIKWSEIEEGKDERGQGLVLLSLSS